jgi:hypothetical protein
MCCVAEIAMFVFGIIALVKGKFSLTGSRIVHQVPARIIGVILLLPLIIGQGVGFAIGFAKGAEFAAKGKEFSFHDAMSLQGPILAVNGIVTGVSLLAALGIAIGTAKPKSKRRRMRDEDEHNDYDDRLRRRRDDDEDQDEPPRRRRRDDDDDEQPRRRPDDRYKER